MGIELTDVLTDLTVCLAQQMLFLTKWQKSLSPQIRPWELDCMYKVDLMFAFYPCLD